MTRTVTQDSTAAAYRIERLSNALKAVTEALTEIVPLVPNTLPCRTDGCLVCHAHCVIHDAKQTNPELFPVDK